MVFIVNNNIIISYENLNNNDVTTLWGKKWKKKIKKIKKIIKEFEMRGGGQWVVIWLSLIIFWKISNTLSEHNGINYPFLKG